MLEVLLILSGIVSAPIEMQYIPIASAHAHTWVADANRDDIADLFVLDADQLAIYENAHAADPLLITLSPETTAVDVADIDGDGFSELVTLSERTVLRYDLVGELAGKAQTLFALDSIPPGFHGPPFLHVMCLVDEDEAQIVLPDLTGLVFYGVDGTRQSNEKPDSMERPQAFKSWSVQSSSLAGPEQLEIRFEYAWRPQAISIADPSATDMKSAGAGPYRLRQAAGYDVARWPSFPLDTSANPSGARAFLAVEGAETGETLVRVERRAGDEETPTLGPVRRYPGQPLMVGNNPPDYNGDGFSDLVLWKTRQPLPTVGALSRALSVGTWPVDVSVHLYDEEKSTFASRAAGAIPLRTSIDRFFGAGLDVVPLALAQDMNGDGFADFACATSETEYSIWFWEDNKLSRDAAYVYRAEDTIVSIAFQATLPDDGGMMLGLRTASGLTVLRPAIEETQGISEDPAVRARIRYLRGLVGSP